MWISGTDRVEDADPFTRFVGDAPSRTRSERELLTLWYTVQRRPSAAALKAYGRLLTAPARPDRLGERERREREADSADRRRRQFADDASADGDLVAW